METIAYPVHIEKVYRAYHANETIPWADASTVATCRTLSGLSRRFAEERATVRHDHGASYSGHVRAIDARGHVLGAEDIAGAVMDRDFAAGRL